MNLKKLTPGKNPPEEILVIVEIPEASRIKYEMDKDTETIMVDRFAFTSMGYPANYGFIPGTMAGDGDPADVLVLSSYPILPGCGINCTPIGVLEMEDEAGIDAKIIAVPLPKVDPIYGMWKDISDVPDAVKNKIKHFFEHYKELEKGKWVKVKEWHGKEKALEEVKNSIK